MIDATIQLREKIISGSIPKNQFTEIQLKNIFARSETIEGYTWHHNAQSAPDSMHYASCPTCGA